jgi:hypothetical protein
VLQSPLASAKAKFCATDAPSTTNWRAVEEFVKVYMFPFVAVNFSPNTIGVSGLPAALPFRAIEEADAPVKEVPTTRLLVPATGVPVMVIRFDDPLIATAPVDLIWAPTSIPNVAFPVIDRAPTLLVPVTCELVKDAVLVPVAPTLKEPEPE